VRQQYSEDSEYGHFESMALEYETQMGLTTLAAIRKMERLCDTHVEWLSGAPAGPVLELGAGTGYLTRRLAPRLRERRYIATDLSPAMLEIAHRSMTPTGRAEWVVGDCTHLDLADASVAGVVGQMILHHLPIEAALREVARLLTPGGRIAFYEPNIVNPVHFLQKKVPGFRPRHDTPGETALYAPTIRRMLWRLGFSRVSVTPCEFVVNRMPAPLTPYAERVSRSMERVPLVRELGGSLRIYAERA
jgi:ubiquinone/menaquinone biosynthesis C-methylase UbiE